MSLCKIIKRNTNMGYSFHFSSEQNRLQNALAHGQHCHLHSAQCNVNDLFHGMQNATTCKYR